MARTLYFFCLSSPFKIASSGFVSSLTDTFGYLFFIPTGH
ncbi:hypothetical protein YPPY76_2861 [Yersinia pestis PY-76]|nr:hypothetical protein YPPY76_2861 [Yersinia pestis PY-76]